MCRTVSYDGLTCRAPINIQYSGRYRPRPGTSCLFRRAHLRTALASLRCLTAGIFGRLRPRTLRAWGSTCPAPRTVLAHSPQTSRSRRSPRRCRMRQFRQQPPSWKPSRNPVRNRSVEGRHWQVGRAGAMPSGTQHANMTSPRRATIVTYIERTYHRRRRQTRLGRLTPIEYEAIMTPAAAGQAA